MGSLVENFGIVLEITSLFKDATVIQARTPLSRLLRVRAEMNGNDYSCRVLKPPGLRYFSSPCLA